MTPKARLKKRGDKMWYLKYLKDECEACGEGGVLQGHHFYYRSSYGHLRYFEDNHITLCRGCHFVLHHQDPHRIEDKIVAVRGEEWHKELKEKAYNPPNNYKDTMEWIRGQLEL